MTRKYKVNFGPAEIEIERPDDFDWAGVTTIIDLLREPTQANIDTAEQLYFALKRCQERGNTDELLDARIQQLLALAETLNRERDAQRQEAHWGFGAGLRGVVGAR